MRRERDSAEEGPPPRTRTKELPRKTAPSWRLGLKEEEEEEEGASRQPRRFLKQKPAAGATNGPPTTGLLSAPPSRPSPALRKAAQIQTRISLRRREEIAGHRAAFLDASELSSSDPDSVWRGSRDPKDRQDGLQGPPKRPSSAQKKDPPGPAAPLRPPSRAGAPSPWPQGPPLEDKDEDEEEPGAVRSLDELFSDRDRDASVASSDSDFRVNVLSLDDLAPAGGTDEEDEEEEAPREEQARPVVGGPRKTRGASSLAPLATPARSVFSAPKEVGGRGPSSKEEEEAGEVEEAGEAEISERLGSPSEAPPSSSGSADGAEYLDDFEPPSSSSSAASQPSSEEGAASQESPSEASPPRSTRSGPSSLRRLPGTTKQRTTATTTTTDAAVQTDSPPPHSPWREADIPIIGLAFGGGSSMGAGAIGSPALSLEDVEGLAAAHSPPAFALNEMLKENLLFIRHFSDTSRRLHASLVASLEEERFHYHTLEEARRYIQSHKARPLNVEGEEQAAEAAVEALSDSL